MDAARQTSVPAPLSHAEVRNIIVGVMVAMFLAALDQTIIATALPTIGRDLGNFEDVPWVVTAYLVAATAVTPLYGKFSDIHGRRITMLIGIATFIVGSVACALAPTMLVLIVARAVQGLGGGGLISIAQTAIGDVSAPRERGRYQAYFATVFASSSLAGPVLGGFFAEHLHWTAIFWINLPLGLLAYFMSSAALKRLPRHERPHRLDVLGAALIVAATVTLLLALSWGGIRYAWASPQILGLLAGSFVFWALFAVRLLTASEPLIPLTVLRHPVVLFGTASASFAMGSLIGLTIFVPVYFEGVLGLTASQSGLGLIPLTIGTVCGATFAGRSLSHVRHYRRIPIAGLLLSIAACLVLAIVPHGLPFPLMLVLLAAISVGMGTVLPVSTVAVQNAVPPHQLGTTTAAMNFFRQLGGALTVAAFGAILLSGSSLAVSGLGLDALAKSVGGGDDLIVAFRWVFAAAFATLAASLVLLFFMHELPLRSAVAPHEDPAGG
jgi:EmrB/QacA subfamily drug resistance transporter